MYDPAVVDAFESIRAELEAQPVDEPLPDVLDRFAKAAREMHGQPAEPEPVSLDLRLHATNTLLRLYDQLSQLDKPASLADTCDVVTRYLLRLAPASLVVFFRRDEHAEDLSVTYASGFGESLFEGLTIPMGHGVSGWVAANGRSVLNADPNLDLGEQAGALTPALRSVLSVPLSNDRAVVGSISLYSIQAQAFTDEQRQLIELISRPVAEALSTASADKATADVVRRLHGIERDEPRCPAARRLVLGVHEPAVAGRDVRPHRRRCDSHDARVGRGEPGHTYRRSDLPPAVR